MPKFNVDDYVMVEDRIKKFREKHPDGQIKTELVASTPDLQSVIVKAEVYDKEGNMLGSDQHRTTKAHTTLLMNIHG